MNKETNYDIIGIGIGPFNLSLAALAENIPSLKCKFIDRSPSFDWHPGLLLPNTRLQVPFYADLVTVADPTNKFSYMNFLKSKGRMFRFAILENNFITRIEYNQYCQWVISQLTNLEFGLTCQSIHFDEESKVYTIYATEPGGFAVRFHAKHIVIGVGTVPNVPECSDDLNHPLIFHSSDYLFRKSALLKQKNISLVGSGQSAAEIFYDLLQNKGGLDALSWYTRSEYIFPMDNSKFAFEMTSPDFVDYFFNLSAPMKKRLRSRHDRLYKGVNAELIDAIQAQLYQFRIQEYPSQPEIFTSSTLDHIRIENDKKICLQFYHETKEEFFEHKTGACILATGYKNIMPEFLNMLENVLGWAGGVEGQYSVNRNYSIDKNNSIFVQNADLHSHGFNSADLGMGPYRNATILNTILGKEYFRMEKNIAFQQFGMTGDN